MPTTPPTSRRWFHFSLRMLFVVVTLLAAILTPVYFWYVTHIAWIHARTKARDFARNSNIWGMVQSSDTTRLPFSLRMLGESHAVERFYIYEVPLAVDAGEARRAKELKMLFPEAIIEVRRR